MRRFVGNITLLVSLFIYSAIARPKDAFQDADLKGQNLEVIPFEAPEPPPNEEWRRLIPPIDHLTVNSKEYCDKQVGITEAYRAGQEPSWGQWQRFDWCQRSLNRQQGIGVR